MVKKKYSGLIKENHTPMQGTPASESSAGSPPLPVTGALSRGKANAISAQDLCNALGFESVRELQKEIARERAAGALILSTCHDGGGYYLPAEEKEVKEFIRTLENRARNTFLALRSAKKYINGGQEKNGRSEVD